MLDRMKTRRGILAAYGLCLLTVFVLWTPPQGYRNIVLPKHLLFLGLTGLLLLDLAVTKGKPGPVRPLPLALAGGLLGLILLSAAVSDYPEVVWLGNHRWEGALTWALYLGVFAAAALWGRLGDVHAMGTAVTSVLMLLLAAAQFLGYNPLGLYPEGLTFHDRELRYSGAYLGAIGNADLLSAWLTMAVLYLLGHFAVTPGRRGLCSLVGGGAAWLTLLLSEVTGGPVAVAVCLGVCLPVCLAKGVGVGRFGAVAAVLAGGLLAKSLLGYTYVDGNLRFFWNLGGRSAALACLTGLCLLWAWLSRRCPKGRGYPRLAKAYVAVALVSILGGLCFLFFYRGENQTLAALSQLLHGHPPDTLGSSRIAIWKEAVAMGMEKPLLGGGPDTYQLRSTLIFSRVLESGQVRRASVDAAHCEYLNLWVNTGLPSMGVYVALLASVLWPGLRGLRRERLPLLLPCLGYAIHALYGISQSLVTPVFFLFLGCLAHGEAGAPGE